MTDQDNLAKNKERTSSIIIYGVLLGYINLPNTQESSPQKKKKKKKPYIFLIAMSRNSFNFIAGRGPRDLANPALHFTGEKLLRPR
jgi:hypothetical protein